jgi:hypothetical protein
MMTPRERNRGGGKLTVAKGKMVGEADRHG